MIKCYYCGRWFKNKQALRGHLRSCKPYIALKSERGITGPCRDAIPNGYKARYDATANESGLWNATVDGK
jgi:hypothetical protein